MAQVVILLALYNGARYLQAQLDSFAAQDWTDWSLLVSDDGSTDAGPDMVQAFAASHPGHEVRLIAGPRQGFAANFLHLLAQVGPEAGFAALSDQDDVWLPHKLRRAVDRLTETGEAALYSARTRIVGPELQPLGLSPVWQRPFGFGNALVQNVAAGNTVVLNRVALERVQIALRQLQAQGWQGVSAHDWFLYQLVAGMGGTVLRDEEPVLLYRQHGQNAMGDNGGVRAAARRLGLILSGRFRDWNDRNVAALRGVGDLLLPEARARLEAFDQLRHRGVMGRLRGLAQAGIYRQDPAGELALWLSALLGRL